MSEFKPAAEAVVVSAWGVFADLVVPCYYFAPGPVNKGTMECIFRPVRSRFVDGTTVKIGDSEVLIPASQITSVAVPAAGDYLLTVGGTHRWDVIAGQLETCQVLMRLFVRAVY